MQKDQLPAVRIGMVHYMIPYAVLPLYANMKGIDARLVPAARGLGASATQAFVQVYLPLSVPGIIGAGLLVFILSLGFYVTPALLGGGRVILVSMKIQQNAGLYFDWGAASSLGVILLVITFLIFWILGRFMRIERLFGGR